MLAAIAIALMAPAGSAQADGTLAAACELDGVTGSATTPVSYLGGNGIFDFSGIASCAVDHNGNTSVYQGAYVSAWGTYANTICGSSVWVGNLDVGMGSASFSSMFQISFMSFEGVMTGRYTGSQSFAGHTGSIPGLVTLVPSDAGKDTRLGGTCSTQFGLRGVFALV